MLVITRQLNESLNIGGDIEVRVVQVKPGAVRLAISAPKESTIHRGEVWEALQSRLAADEAIEPPAEDRRPSSQSAAES